MATVANESMNKLSGAVRDFKTKEQGLERNIEKTVATMGERLGTIASDVSHAATNYVETGREFVRENPARGVAYAALGGVVVGALVTMALRRS